MLNEAAREILKGTQAGEQKREELERRGARVEERDVIYI